LTGGVRGGQGGVTPTYASPVKGEEQHHIYVIALNLMRMPLPLYPPPAPPEEGTFPLKKSLVTLKSP